MTDGLPRLLLAIVATLGLVIAPTGAMAQDASGTDPVASGEKVLAIGSAGPRVERLQQQLNAWMAQTDVDRDLLAVDGIYGPRTMAAAMVFEDAHDDLRMDGIVGPRTWRVLQDATGDGTLHAEDVLSDAIDTSQDTGEPAGPPVAVTDVRVGAHDGFDRVTFEIGGEGEAGWHVRYVEEARAQGSGHTVDLAGDAVLEVSLRNIAYPTDAPAGVEPWDGPVHVAAGSPGPVIDVVEDTIFEGHHVFFLGVSGEQPFQVRRFDSPQRVVVDVAAADAPAGQPAGDLTRCEHPDGFSVAYPQDWHTTDGDPLGPCSQFHPEPFEVPVGTDERVAAITAYIDPVPFHEVAAPDADRDADRAATTVDGLQAVRLSYTSDGRGLWPEGTPITMYAVDLSPGLDEGPGTLFLDTIGLSIFDYERNQAVLDRMARTLEVTHDEVETDPDVVARYEGGGGGFSVEGEARDEEACLRIPPHGEPVCTGVPEATTSTRSSWSTWSRSSRA